MRKLNHYRPALQMLDNLRRELNKEVPIASTPIVDTSWPDYLRPVVSRRAAHVAFSELLEAINAWTEEAEVLSFSNLSPRLKNAAQLFADVRVENPYDNQYRGRDWITDLQTSDNDNANAWGNVLSIFIDANK
jgi:hypothetical protein